MRQILISILAIVLVIVLCISVWHQQHPCIRSHREFVHHDAYYQPIMAGKVLELIYHPARDVWEKICDERK